MKIILLSIIIIFSCATNANEKLDITTCVLSFFEQSSKEDKVISSIFERYLPSKIIRVTSVEDINRCFDGNFKNILWIGHTVSNPLANQAPLFVYYKNNLPQPIYSRFYENLLKKLSLQDHLPEKIRFAGCGLGQLENGSIHHFIRELENFNIDIELSPKSHFLSKLNGKSVTTLSRSWLIKSVDCDDKSKWARNFPSHFCDTSYFDKTSEIK